ncbi:23S rRNA (adenine(1618)-N(6))-methyltransferase RlmF [Catenovulum maritimum]|uniref:Ribosomal RNA large subunit methyltransferase F n=1 Tax=Catenovulum maritimum TaxID=1513271 RepID=A0A0J8GR18_9ALTE|nr:23S rRNA (adenine(1618)-N(6))-methyltransferase RlmF [Catenovulum maritimum]KMT65147.1 hypothetical protein XM47_10435 [Catenovulum maritimum]
MSTPLQKRTKLSLNKQIKPAAKAGLLHKRHLHNGQYQFTRLIKANPKLKSYVKSNPAGQDTIDFSCAEAVYELNKALLKDIYQIDHWDIAAKNLCPPIPGRADYIHYLADLLPKQQQKSAQVLDIGTGASCIYPIIGARAYNWRFVASDIAKKSVENAQRIIESNQNLAGLIQVRLQSDKQAIFKNMIKPNEYYDLTLCNPPFHDSKKSAEKANLRKVNNLAKNSAKPIKDSKLNFSGMDNELWTKGGEISFILQMIQESIQFAKQVTWFTCLVSKSSNLPAIKKSLEKLNLAEYKIVNMSQGQKQSRFIAWRFKKG